MRLFDRIGLIRALFPTPATGGAAARRWSRAALAEPELAADLIRLSGLLAIQPDIWLDGQPTNAPVDPIRLAINDGRQDLARQLLALMGTTPRELQSMMENDDVDY
jgi:hypothetical protein